ncbi:MAG: restriction endonuclease [Aigarchaeota archaeon]|nr:restriction endonuclease [Candidatus Pelearchaeum maunauluense]
MSYRKGRRLEYIVRDLFLKRGWVVVRSARSKPVDLVCMKAGRSVLVECKYSRAYVRYSEVEPLLELAEKAGAEPVVALAEKRGRIEMRNIRTGEAFRP